MGTIKIYQLLIYILLLSQINKAQEVVCKACNQTIIGKYIVIDGLSYHPNHFKCSKCNKPIQGNYYKENSKYFDKECYANFIAPKCAVCQDPILDKYLTDLYGIKYHNYHENQLQRCDNCNMLISQNTTEGGVQYSDGRNICNICYKKAITGRDRYESSLRKIVGDLKNYGLIITFENIKVIPVDRDELKQVSKAKYSRSARGFCQTKIIKSSSEISLTHDIYILDKIPLKYIEATLSHELMHVWINENVKYELSSQLEEGSCNFISYTYLKSDYSYDAQNIIKQMLNDPNSIYGIGFRKVYKKFKGKDLSELLTYIKKNKTI